MLEDGKGEMAPYPTIPCHWEREMKRGSSSAVGQVLEGAVVWQGMMTGDTCWEGVMER